jgi:hypothetical protein
MPSGTRRYPVSPANHTDLVPDVTAQEAQSVRSLSSGFARNRAGWEGTRRGQRCDLRRLTPVLGLVVVVRFRIIFSVIPPVHLRYGTDTAIAEPLRYPQAHEKVGAGVPANKFHDAWIREVVGLIVAYENGIEEREIGWVAGRGREALTSLPRYVCALQATFQGLENQSHLLDIKFPR